LCDLIPPYYHQSCLGHPISPRAVFFVYARRLRVLQLSPNALGVVLVSEEDFHHVSAGVQQGDEPPLSPRLVVSGVGLPDLKFVVRLTDGQRRQPALTVPERHQPLTGFDSILEFDDRNTDIGRQPVIADHFPFELAKSDGLCHGKSSGGYSLPSYPVE
jgi:hypothetical protein